MKMQSQSNGITPLPHSSMVSVCSKVGLLLTRLAFLLALMAAADNQTIPKMTKTEKDLSSLAVLLTPIVGFVFAYGLSVYHLRRKQLFKANLMAATMILMPVFCAASAMAPGLYVAVIALFLGGVVSIVKNGGSA